MDETKDNERYLVWSHEHGRWWRKSNGYTSHISQAGRFSRTQALDICQGATIGTASRIGAMPELMVREADAEAVRDWYLAKFKSASEDWL
jgi:hypothetical protein